MFRFEIFYDEITEAADYIIEFGSGCRNLAALGRANRVSNSTDTYMKIITDEYPEDNTETVINFLSKCSGITKIDSNIVFINASVAEALPQIIKFIINLYRYSPYMKIFKQRIIDDLICRMNNIDEEFDEDYFIWFRYSEGDTLGERMKMIMLEIWMRELIEQGINPFHYFSKTPAGQGTFLYFRYLNKQPYLQDIKETLIKEYPEITWLINYAYNSIIGSTNDDF